MHVPRIIAGVDGGVVGFGVEGVGVAIGREGEAVVGAVGAG